MASPSFENSPLAELIVELRWNAPSIPQGLDHPNAPPKMVPPDARIDEFFMRFAASVGYSHIERLTPAGFPFLAFQPACRLRETPTSPTLFQIGVGVFTANALPPYENWDKFSPNVRDGITSLLGTRNSDEQEIPFNALTVRYIDAFEDKLTSGMSVADFLKDVLRIDLALPEAISRLIPSGRSYKPHLQLQIPLADNSVMSMLIGEGTTNNGPAIVMDTSVTDAAICAPNLDDVMLRLNVARQAIHNVFFELTEPLHFAMKPVNLS